MSFGGFLSFSENSFSTSVAGDVNVALTGVSSTTGLGTPLLAFGGTFQVAGVAGTTGLGSPIIIGAGIAGVTGSATVGGLGDEIV